MLRLTIGEPRCCPELPAEADVPRWENREGHVFAFGTREDSSPWMHAPGLASFDLQAEIDHVAAYPYEGVRQERICEFFRRTVLPVALQLRGLEVLHASAVVLDSQVVGFAGPSGTGKSTMARALNGTGLLQWADDALACEIGADCVTARFLPFESRVHPETARTLAMTPGPIGDFETGDSLPLRTIYLLEPERSDGRDVEAAPLTKAQAVTALLPQAFYFDLQDPEVRDRMTHHYLSLASLVEVRQLRYRQGLADLENTTRAVRRLIEQGS